MSSTNRGGQRSEADWYATPPWCVHRFLDRFQSPEGTWSKDLPAGRWIEPCAGDGEIIRTINERRSDIIWSGVELREEMQPLLSPLIAEKLIMGDLLERSLDEFGGKKFDVAITNPPFRIALPVVRKCMELANLTVLLLRLNFWGSEERQQFMTVCPPDTYVLPNRPMFSVNQKGKPGTDSPEYAWMVWRSIEEYEEGPRLAKISVLSSTPKAERAKWRDHLKARYEQSLAGRLSAAPAELLVPRGT